MSDEAAADEQIEDDGGDGKSSKKKLILIAGLSLLLLIGIGVGAILMLGIFEEEAVPVEERPEEVAVELSTGNVFMEIPDLIVNLNASGRKSAFLKIKISLEIETAEQN